LEIGPAFGRLKGFETINIVGGLNVDYVYDASKRLPFKDDTFEVVYASHILEHLPWYETKQVLKEWIRVIKKGGNLELWVPDGFKIAKTIVDTEKNKNHSLPDKWIRFNDEKSPYIWANGRVFYGLNGDYPSWHKSLFTPKYLKTILESLGLKEIHVMDEEEYRNNKRGWINLGIKGTKK
jgi:ubiquinone/menaquinone biosynthesis C-methylase UbiE